MQEMSAPPCLQCGKAEARNSYWSLVFGANRAYCFCGSCRADYFAIKPRVKGEWPYYRDWLAQTCLPVGAELQKWEEAQLKRAWANGLSPRSDSLDEMAGKVACRGRRSQRRR